MVKVLIVNSTIKNCGVYQYGKRVSDILVGNFESKYVYYYVEIENNDELNNSILLIIPEIIIYNFVRLTMPWINNDVIDHVRCTGIKQLLIVHDNAYEGFDYYLQQDPCYDDKDNNFHILRPIFDYIPKLSDNGNKIKIGSFGLSKSTKQYDLIYKMVKEQFLNDNVELSFHMPDGYFCSENETSNSIMNECNNDNILLKITTNFLSDNDMLDFLSCNDLNIFLYKHDYSGIASTIDYALSVEKPIAISRSKMFSHINNVVPSICVDDISLKEIINNGFGPLSVYKNAWSRKNFTIRMDYIISIIIM